MPADPYEVTRRPTVCSGVVYDVWAGDSRVSIGREGISIDGPPVSVTALRCIVGALELVPAALARGRDVPTAEVLGRLEAWGLPVEFVPPPPFGGGSIRAAVEERRRERRAEVARG